MKLLLTSGGLKNKSIINELARLTGKKLKSLKAVYVISAANIERGDKSWLIDNLREFSEIFKEVEIADVALPSETWKEQIEESDVIVFGGGNTTYLMRQAKKSGLEKMLPKLLRDKIYVGISAGSIITTPATAPNSDDEEKIKALSFVDFGIQPHYKSETYLPAKTLAKVKKRKKDSKIDYPLYALDDESAISVDEGKIKVISEGDWELID